MLDVEHSYRSGHSDWSECLTSNFHTGLNALLNFPTGLNVRGLFCDLDPTSASASVRAHSDEELLIVMGQG